MYPFENYINRRTLFISSKIRMFQWLPVLIPSLVKTFICRAFSGLVYSQRRVGKLTKSLSWDTEKKIKEWEKWWLLCFGVNWDPSNFFLMCMVLLTIRLVFCLSDTHQNCCSNFHSLPCPNLHVRNALWSTAIGLMD